ncbi:MAG TPA: type II secretion system minor pseudopilin GspI [Hyphomonadaceae bacterium]|nr:type II secretion system minor pseudopilin GspI [Hyphomonadaceae bacterium]HPN04309.1 type II secretion system minor pseudopilin GspI [Hyphomonadaceae bacterium]
MPAPQPDPACASSAGFTIVETLVALFVFALAGVALITMQSQSASALSRVEAHALANLTAENNLIDTLAKRSALELGTRSGEVELAGRTWAWTVDIARTDDRSTLRLKSDVTGPDSNQVSVTAYATAGGAQ